MASKNNIHADIYALELRQGLKNKIKGKFIKTEE